MDETSPLWGKSADNLTGCQAEFLILIKIKGFDDTFFQTVHVRYSYRFEELVRGARFAPAFEVDSHGDTVLELERLSELCPPEETSVA